MTKIENELKEYSKAAAREMEAAALALGLSVEELCCEAGVDRSTFTRWKQGVTKPSFTASQKIKRVLEGAPKKKRPPKSA
jgi:transcriptional regulator with XRE-family HTH domain